MAQVVYARQERVLMGREMRLWVYFIVAFSIAAAAFVLGQFQSGAGVLFVVAASAGWVVFAVSRQRKIANDHS
jgi:drug/metabolite transporter (DMT)-like permease